jgi:c-di-GMP-binding flagellar brake protein YcgR
MRHAHKHFGAETVVKARHGDGRLTLASPPQFERVQRRRFFRVPVKLSVEFAIAGSGP